MTYAAPQNIRIISTFDHSVVGDYLGSAAGERIIMNTIQRNARISFEVPAVEVPAVEVPVP